MDYSYFSVEELKERAPKKMEVFEKLLKNLPHSTWIAGGFVKWLFNQDEKFRDIDLFVLDESHFERVKSHLLSNPQTKSLLSNNFQETFELVSEGDIFTLQLIKIHGPNIESIMDKFDFTICQFGFDGSEFVIGKWSFLDEAQKRLVPLPTYNAIATTKRILKYVSQGYSISNVGIENLLRQCAKDESIIRDDDYIAPS